MDADQALADLMEISSQVDAAVVFDATGAVAGATLPDNDRTEAFARTARELLAAAGEVRRAAGERALTQVEVATRAGSVFVARDGDRAIAATTGPSPTAGLVFYDLKTCLRALADDDAGGGSGDVGP